METARTHVETAVRAALARNDASHDWAHVERVVRNASSIARIEGVHDPEELLIIELGALLHDIADYKYVQDAASCASARDEADRVLCEAGVSAAARAAIVDVVDGVSFRKEIQGTAMRTATSASASRALAIVQDADRLDAMGAIGIARCFTYGGAVGQPLHNPALAPRTPEELRLHYGSRAPAASTPTLNHFYEKLFTLRDTMKTAGGRALASQRHDVMTAFVAQFEAEWAGTR